MASAEEQWSCQKIQDAKSGKAFFVSIAYRAAADGGGSVDLALTDGTSAWTAQGVTSEDIKGQSADKLLHLLAALSELEQAGQQYQTEVAPKEHGSVNLRVAWQKNPGSPRIFITVALSAAVPAGPVVADMLDLLVGNWAALKALSLDLVQQNKAYEEQASRSQDLVDKYVRTKDAQDREYNVKVAALLNSKKKKLRELRAQLQQAQEEIQQLKAGGAVSMEEDAGQEDSDDGQPGPSGRVKHRGRKAAQVVEDEESEEEEEGSDRSREATPERD